MRVLSALATVLISVVIGFGLFEVYTRIFETDGQNFDIEMWRYAKDLKRVSDIPGMGHEHVPGTEGVYMGVPVKINSVGWRDDEHPIEKPAATTRIMMLGDSLTFGWGVPADGVTSNILEQRLNGAAADGGYEILNTGIGNTNTAMQLAYFLAEGKAYKPDVVVLNYFINDAEPTPSRKAHWLLNRSYAAVFLASRFDTLMRSYFDRGSWLDYYRGLYTDDQPGWREAQAAFRRLAAFCRENNIALMVAHYPELHQLDPYPFAEVTQLVAKMAESEGVPFLDLLPGVQDKRPTSLWVTPTDAHPNKLAAQSYSAQIAAALQSRFRALFLEHDP